MPIINRTILSFAASCLLSSAVAAQPTTKLPPAVQKEITEMTAMCRDVGGKPVNSPGLLTEADLTGDGVNDYVIDQGVFNCDGAASLFSGSGGSQMSIYVSTSSGQAAATFNSGAFGVKVDQAVTPAKVLVMVGGELCGQKVSANTARSEFTHCWRPVDWNAKTGKMQFAPTSKVRPVQ